MGGNATETVQPKASITELRKKYAAYVIIDRKAHQLRLYTHLALDQGETFGPFIAGRCVDLGRAGAEAIGMGDLAFVRVERLD